MKIRDWSIIINDDSPFWNQKDIKKYFGCSDSTAYKYIKEFFEFSHEKHIYPMECAFTFFDKKIVNKFAFLHYFQNRNNIVNNFIYDKYDDNYVDKLKKQIAKMQNKSN